MNIIETERTYCFELTVPQMRRLLKRDEVEMERACRTSERNSSREGYRSLATILRNTIPAVYAVEYDAMFGPIVSVRIDSRCAVAETLKNVKKAIAQYVR